MRRRLLSAGAFDFPEYIEADGLHYINTGILTDDNNVITAAVSFGDLADIPTAARQYVIGAYGRESGGSVVNSRTQLIFGGDGTISATATQNTLQTGWGNNWSFYNNYVITTNVTTIEMTKEYVKINGTAITANIGHTFTNPKEIFAFALNDDGTPYYPANKLRLHRLSITNRTALYEVLSDFLPAVNRATGERGLLNVVTREFLPMLPIVTP